MDNNKGDCKRYNRKEKEETEIISNISPNQHKIVFGCFEIVKERCEQKLMGWREGRA